MNLTAHPYESDTFTITEERKVFRKGCIMTKINKRNHGIVFAAALFLFLTLSSFSDAFFAPSCFFGMISLYCFLKSRDQQQAPGCRAVPFSKGDRVLTAFCAFLFSAAVTASNYRCMPVFQLFILFLSGFYLAVTVLVFFGSLVKNGTVIPDSSAPYRLSPSAVFLSVFLLTVLINSVVLFSGYYPGCLSNDSLNQILQGISGEYSNHHPYFHTLLIRGILSFGSRVWGSLNAGIACYSVFQIVFLALCFSYSAMTLCQLRVPARLLLADAVCTLLMPFHIFYSFTMWKDCLFGGFVLLFAVSGTRIIRGIGQKSVNRIILTLSGLGICLFRGNGFYAFVLVTLLSFLIFRKSDRSFCFLLAGISVFSFLLLHPVLNALNVEPSETVESLSVPLQQIAKVITDCNDLTPEEYDCLSNVMDLSKVPESYIPFVSDPIKFLAADSQPYILSHKKELAGVYLSLGLRHPVKYIDAWINQTRGYWNSGYDYWRWFPVIEENGIGAYQTVNVPVIREIMTRYARAFETFPLLQLFVSIGLSVWITAFLGYLCLIRRDFRGMIPILLVLSVVLSLVIATPVYSEFRYAYSVFCCLPFLIFLPFLEKAPVNPPAPAKP